MKIIRPDGTILEGEPEELRKFEAKNSKKIEAKEEPEEEPVEAETRTDATPLQLARQIRKSITGKHITGKDYKQLLKLVIELVKTKKVSFKCAFVKVFKRGCGGSDYVNARKLGYTDDFKNRRSVYKTKKFRTWTEQSKQKVRDRATFMNKRANFLMRQDKGMGRSKAYQIASSEWNSKKAIGKVIPQAQKPEQEFPMVYPVNEESTITLKSLVQHAIVGKGTIKFHDVFSTLQLVEGKEWDGRIWHEFVVQFLLNSKKMIDYFNAKGKFVHDRDGGGYEVIRYVSKE